MSINRRPYDKALDGTPLSEPTSPEQAGPGPSRGQQWLLAVLSVSAGAAALAPRAVPSELGKVSLGIVVAVLLLLISLVLRRSAYPRPYWGLAFAFFIFAFVQVLNNSVPYLVGTYVLNQQPVTGDPLGSTVAGTLIIQLFETAIAVIPVVGLALAAGWERSTVFAQSGKAGLWLAISITAFVLFYLATTSGHLARIFPTNGSVTLARTLPLTPALLVLVISNGFQEEFLFRGLFLRRYLSFFGTRAALVVQSLVFSIAHLGVMYTPSAIIFVTIIVFPLGLLLGYIMRSTNGILSSAIFHAGTDIPIYLAFLTYVA